MKIFILAAGIGSRLSRYSQGKPKCLLTAGGKTLIKRLVEQFKTRNIFDITVIVGYKNKLIMEELKDQANYVYNPFYQVTNSIASLWFARNLLEGDIIILNGDLFLDDAVIDAVLDEKRNPVMFSDSSRIMEADYRFKLRDGCVVGYGKDLLPEQTDAEYVGIAKIQSQFTPQFQQRLINLVEKEHYTKWWEDVLYSFTIDGLNIYTKDISGMFWAEVDYVEDYERIQEWVKKYPGVL